VGAESETACSFIATESTIARAAKASAAMSPHDLEHLRIFGRHVSDAVAEAAPPPPCQGRCVILNGLEDPGGPRLEVQLEERALVGVDGHALTVCRDVRVHSDEHEINPFGHHYDQLEAWTASAALAALTERIEIITAIKPLLYHPVVLAKQALQIEDRSRGRFAINLVNAWYKPEIEPAGIAFPDHDERYVYGQEWIDVVKGLLSGERSPTGAST
jgi:hypothetical protein